jgi:hypothetical protein
MPDHLVAALAHRGHDLRRVVVYQAVGVVRGGQLELVEELEQPPHADAVAVVAPRVVALRLRLAHLGGVMPQAGAEGVPLDVGGNAEGEPPAAWPAVVLALRQRDVVVALVLGKERSLLHP